MIVGERQLRRRPYMGELCTFYLPIHLLEKVKITDAKALTHCIAVRSASLPTSASAVTVAGKREKARRALCT